MLALRVFCFSPIIAVLTGLALGQQPAQNPSNSAIRQAVQLAREHRYAEAEATVQGVNAPADPDQKIAFFRLKAAIASGLGHFAAAAENMDNAARLAPGNQDLRIAAGIARLQDQVENHSNRQRVLSHQTAGIYSMILPWRNSVAVASTMLWPAPNAPKVWPIAAL